MTSLNPKFKVVNFYKFQDIEPEGLVARLRDIFAKFPEVKGSIVLASEGINGGFAGPEAEVDQMCALIHGIETFRDLEFKATWGDTQAFRRQLVKIKKQILTFPPSENPSIAAINAGQHLSSEEWDALLEQPDVVVVDTRNTYEIDYGTFAKAEHCDIQRFVDFPQKFLEQYGSAKGKTFLMFCTGGIRCEKAVAFANEHGFEKVYQLDGGIIRYLERSEGKHWNGDCFVFDHRWAVDKTLIESTDEGTIAESRAQ